ncbi:monovalent cation:proton antiporter-2 (CPA2) family protein [candidate division CSSED10-310 bacterium]|uniref:Monovalent cation:proton antiporter-2 (CPA2) family protein n=1 Tax=candidate division CSSED10-310 bacterium TaxID=2855610 RepID=A0ABV6Z070_UNCC1
MNGEGFFYQAFVYLAAAVIAVPIAKRFGLGSVLGYLIAGVVIGPYGFQCIGQEGQDIMHFAEFGVVMMLFLIGLELQPSLFWKMRGQLLGMGGSQVVMTTGAFCLILSLFSLSWKTSLAISMTVALSSTAIVLQTLQEKGLMKTDAGQSSFAVLLFQDIAVIPMLALFPLLANVPRTNSAGVSQHSPGAGHHEMAWVDTLPAWGQALAVVGAVATIIILGLYLARPVLRAIARTRMRELFTAAALLLVISIALLMKKVGLSPALGTFLAGVVLANSEYRHELEGDIEPFKGLLLGLFFIAVGASINFTLIISRPGLISFFVVALFVVKFLILLIIGRFFSMSLDQNMLFGLVLAQGGEFAFVLFSFAAQHHVMSPAYTSIAIAVVALSMIVTPLVLLFNERMLQPVLGTKQKDDRPADAIDEENPVIIAGFGQFGNVVGRLLKANGIQATVLEYDSDKVDVLRKLGLKVYYGDASRYDLLLTAGAEKAKLLIVTLDEENKIHEIVDLARKYFPHLTILTRALGRTHAYELYDSGLEYIFRDTVDTALHLGIAALKILGFRAFQARRAAKIFKQHDEESVQHLSVYRHDQSLYVSEAKKKIQDLESILLAEIEFEDEHRDAGWDTTTLRQEFGQATDTDGC